MASSPTPTWLGVILVPLGFLFVAIPGMWVYMSSTAGHVHPNPETAPSVAYSAPAPGSASAVEQARRLVRARLTEDNLPGVSVAVGIGGNIVWAEGFGFADLNARTPVTPNHRFRIG